MFKVFANPDFALCCVACVLLDCVCTRSLRIVFPPHVCGGVADLRSVKADIADGKIRTLEHLAAELEIMFNNCKAYNKPDTEYYAIARLRAAMSNST